MSFWADHSNIKLFLMAKNLKEFFHVTIYFASFPLFVFACRRQPVLFGWCAQLTAELADRWSNIIIAKAQDTEHFHSSQGVSFSGGLQVPYKENI